MGLNKNQVMEYNYCLKLLISVMAAGKLLDKRALAFNYIFEYRINKDLVEKFIERLIKEGFIETFNIQEQKDDEFKIDIVINSKSTGDIYISNEDRNTLFDYNPVFTGKSICVGTLGVDGKEVSKEIATDIVDVLLVKINNIMLEDLIDLDFMEQGLEEVFISKITDVLKLGLDKKHLKQKVVLDNNISKLLNGSFNVLRIHSDGFEKEKVLEHINEYKSFNYDVRGKRLKCVDKGDICLFKKGLFKKLSLKRKKVHVIDFVGGIEGDLKKGIGVQVCLGVFLFAGIICSAGYYLI